MNFERIVALFAVICAVPLGIGQAAAADKVKIGFITTSNWSPELDNPANKKFVADYRAKHGATPTSMAAMGYDTMMLIDAAMRDSQGWVEDKDAFRGALRKANFQSVRGPIKFSNNHFPAQSYYLNEVAKGADG